MPTLIENSFRGPWTRHEMRSFRSGKGQNIRLLDPGIWPLDGRLWKHFKYTQAGIVHISQDSASTQVFHQRLALVIKAHPSHPVVQAAAAQCKVPFHTNRTLPTQHLLPAHNVTSPEFHTIEKKENNPFSMHSTFTAPKKRASPFATHKSYVGLAEKRFICATLSSCSGLVCPKLLSLLRE